MKPTIRESLPETIQPFEPSLYDIVREGLALFMTRFGALRAGMTANSASSQSLSASVSHQSSYVQSHPASSGFE